MKTSDIPYDWVVKCEGEIPSWKFFMDEARATKYAAKMNNNGYYAHVIEVHEKEFDPDGEQTEV